MRELFQHRVSDYTFSDIDSLLQKSEHGSWLSKNVRWGTFKPRSITNEQWVGLLGRDANNFDHMRLMRGFTGSFIRYCNGDEPSMNCYVTFDPLETRDLLLTATFHDLPEAKHGDKPAPSKTIEDDRAEAATLIDMTRELFGFNTVPLEISTIQNIMTDRTHKLGAAWRCIEDLAYLRDGVIGYKQLLEVSNTPVLNGFSRDQSEEIRGNLTAMVFRIWEREVRTALSHIQKRKYYAVDRLLQIYAPVISHAFNELDYKRADVLMTRLNSSEGSSTHNSMIESFLDARALWEQYYP